MQINDIENIIEYLFSAALKKCENFEDAEDLTSETLLAALNCQNNNLKISKDGYVKVYLNNGKQIIYIDSRGGKSKADGIYILRGTANNRFDLTKTN